MKIKPISSYIFKIKQAFTSKTGKDVVTVYSGKILEALLGLVSSILIARELGPTNLGILMSLIAFSNIVSCLMGYGLDVTVVKYVADYRKNNINAISALLRNIIELRFIFITVFAILVYICKDFILGNYIKYVSSNYMFYLTIILAASNSMFFLCQSTVRGFERFVKNVLSNTTGRVLRLVFILFYILYGTLTVEKVLLANIIAALMVILIDAIFIKKEVPVPANAPADNTSLFREIFKYSFWMYIAAILVIVFNNMNIMMLNYYSVAASVGLYAMAENLLRPFEFLPETLNQVFLPKVSTIDTRNDFITFTKRIVLLGGIIAACMSPLFLFPKTIISIIYGSKYADGALLLQLLALNLSIGIFLNPLYIFAHRLNIPRIFTLSGCVALLVGFIANSQFIPKYGEVGCALALLIVSVFSKTIILPTIYFRANKVFK